MPKKRLTKPSEKSDDHKVPCLATTRPLNPQDFGWLNGNYRKAKAALEASGLDIVPCMNDTLAGNFLLDDDNNVMLVDFEYASGNDRCAELARI